MTASGRPPILNAMKKAKNQRRTLEQTWRKMRWGRRPLIDHHAGYEREGDPADITFFRSRFEDADLSNLTMPRQYVNRSGFERVSFRNSDLNQSFMCWNDFVECDFSDADLACCDMRASVFRDCSFVRCRCPILPARVLPCRTTGRRKRSGCVPPRSR